MESNKYENKPKYEELEGLRGIAAIFVVFFHIPIWNPILDTSIIRNSYLMVDLFFVLSGFIICNNYKEINDKNNFIKFVFLRFGRLYPIHLTILLIYILFEVVKYYSVAEWGVAVYTQALDDGFLLKLLQNFFLVQAIFGNGSGLNVPAWSVSVEFYTYMLFGIICLFSKPEYKNYIYIVIFFSSLILLITNTYSFDGIDSIALLRCFTGFFLGCIASYTKEASKYIYPSYFPLIGVVLIIFFLLIKPDNEDYDVIIYFFSVFLILSLVSSRHSYLGYFLRTKFIVFLGTISYSVYMSHFIIIRFFDLILRRFFSFPLKNYKGAVVVDLNIFQTIFLSCLLILITVFFSFLLYKFIEAPFRLKSRHYALKNFI